MGLPAFSGFPFPVETTVAPPVPTSGLVLWLDATRGLSFDGSTSRIAAWSARVGGAVAAQATTASMPVLGTMNGLPSVSFDGADDFLSILNPMTAGERMTAFFVLRQGAESAYRSIVTGAAGAFDAITYDDSSLAFRIVGAGSFAQSPVGVLALGRPTIIGFTFDRNGGSGGPWTIRVNRAVVARGTASVPAFSAPTDQISVSGYALTGLLSEWLLYSRTLSDAECGQVEAYLRAKWGTA